MPPTRRIPVALACLFLAGACGGGSDGAGAGGGQASAFSRALASAYGELAGGPAGAAATERDNSLASYFRQRRERAAAGDAPPPQPLFDLELPANRVLDLSDARLQLNGLLMQHDARRAAPELAARAQSRFDCWAMAVARRAPAEPVANCRQAFEKALAKLRGAVATGGSGSA